MECARCKTDFPARPTANRKYCGQDCYWSARREERAKTVGDREWKCGKCRRVLARSDFYTHGKRAGMSGWCKSCRCADERRRRGDARLVAKFHDKYESDMDFRAQELLRAVGKRCRRKGLAFDLDEDWLSARLRSGVCELTGLPFDPSVRTRKPNPYTPSIDRIAPKGGYTKGNCRVIVYALNMAMRDLGLEAFLPIAEALVRRSEARAA